MISKCFLSFLLSLSTSLLLAQTFVGELLTSDGYQYIKLETTDDSLYVSFPYEFRQTFGFPLKPKAPSTFEVKARAEKRLFTIDKIDSHFLNLTAMRSGQKQVVRLHRQMPPIEDENLLHYSGAFSDKYGNKAILYALNGYLHLMSPYSEQTVSLKPIGKNKFWSTSGETTVFSEEGESGFDKIELKRRNGDTSTLQRSFSYHRVEDWVMVDNDSIYVNVFIPNTEGKKPACLLLPGGGGQSQMENFKYEARLFASHGMVAMTFDKSGVGQSHGQNFEYYTFEEKAVRYAKLFEYLKSREEVDAEKVGIHGPSEGGRLALMMGINLGKGVAFINATAAPIMTMLEGQLYAADHYSRNLGLTEEEIVTTLVIWRNYYHGILNDRIDTTDFESIRTLRSKYRRAFLPPLSDAIPLSPKKEDLTENNVVYEAKKLASPVFLQYGENDQRVDPTGSLQNFYQNISDDLEVTAELYKRGNHSMMTPEYQICPGYAYDKIKWLRSIGIIE